MVVISAVSITQSPAAEQGPFELELESHFRQTEEDRLLIGLSKAREAELIRVTEKPHRVPNLNTICRQLTPDEISLLTTPHVDFWIHVFVTPEATNIIRSSKGVYPEGTIILKQKFLDAEAKQTEFFTGMRKRETGYNPDCGDWEFFTLDKTGTKVTARGKIDSCMDCHANFKETDFVSRKYLKPPAAQPAPAE